MAHFAKLGLDNVVLRVTPLDNIKTMTRGGIEQEEIGVEYLTKHHGHSTWKKCSCNTLDGTHTKGGTPFRANYPSPGWYYNSEHDIFHEPRPEGCDSWTLNWTTGRYDCPLGPAPELTVDDMIAYKEYVWDEDLYQSDNTQGWVLRDRSN